MRKQYKVDVFINRHWEKAILPSEKAWDNKGFYVFYCLEDAQDYIKKLKSEWRDIEIFSKPPKEELPIAFRILLQEVNNWEDEKLYKYKEERTK